ncbi:M15 family metallopeptidase [Anaerococcus porci]|uniref:M15 family metallopeptidase n=1 Tax=Anaerococcus porci TaxID=2652269 RepID=UPI002A749DAE|nr:M15 family metallopeptidase [Anaerococcus porci]MDY3006064.1 M15 family metallopeptidase [Anaerococcus porci]
MANKSIRDLRRKKRREKKKRLKNKIIKVGIGIGLLTAAFNIDLNSDKTEIPIRRSVENRTAQANKKDEIEKKKETKTQIATPLGFEKVEVKDGLKIENDGYENVQKSFVRALNTQYCYQKPEDFTKTDQVIEEGDYVAYYGTENSFSKIKVGDNFYYVNRYGLSKLDEESQINVIKGIVFVNENNPLPKDFRPGLDATSKSALATMINNMQREGLDLRVASDYRLPETEEKLNNQDHVDKDLPFTSEHQTGTAFDFFTDEDNKYSEKFKDTDEYKWLKENAYKYGFIERYPKEKESITKHKERCWHFRYVGVENAKYMYDNNLSLEEYLKIK